MLSEMKSDVPQGEYLYEVKWDGIRAMISIDDGNIRIMSRNQKDITHLFPELLVPEEAFRANNGLFDAEIVSLDENGHPSFRKVVSRLHHNNEGKINHASKKNPAHCYIFDCLYLDGRILVNEPLHKRRTWLKDSVRPETPYRVSEVIEDGQALFDAAKSIGLEGIMAKDSNGKYYPGRRSDAWVKVKVRNTVDCVILGYTMGKGDRSGYFGALQIAEYHDGEVTYRGKVGSGFSQKIIKEIHDQLIQLEEINKPGIKDPQDPKNTTWVAPVYMCEIQYASITSNNTYREPVFLRMRPDLEYHVD
jgi:DNA ligase D-like protein (predicted ligase)